MSWFDASGLANIAKSALKEAQRTIDKALDIKAEEGHSTPSNTPIDTDNDFFGTWGVGVAAAPPPSPQIKDIKDDEAKKMQSSLWGSFAGSFFEPPKDNEKNILDDSTDVSNEHFSSSKLVVQQSEESDGGFHRLISTDSESSEKIEHQTPSGSPERQTEVMRRENTSESTNRLSVISTESGKNSSESVELLTCGSPDCETLSADHSISTKQTTESVEVIGESPSLSSVEVISSDYLDIKDAFSSPLESPMTDDEIRPSLAPSVDNPEILPEDQEESLAEDTVSYTSISEGTAATVLDSTMLLSKPQKMLKDTYNAPMPEALINPDKHLNYVDAIVKPPSRSAMHLPLSLIDTQPQSSRQDLSNLLQITNIIDIPKDTTSMESLIESNDESSQSDRTIVARDGGMDSSSDTSTTEMGMSSNYLKNLLADAMTEKSSGSEDHFVDERLDLSQSMIVSAQSQDLLQDISITQLEMPPSRNSPVSSESRSDLVKIGSDHTSGHTSGDELETTTSSDIEIISSPNGDSSSTHSRQSPARQSHLKTKCDDTKIELLCKMTMKKAKGHTRELSEASSISDDSAASEVDRLIKRITDMTGILESRESKLIDMNRRNAELEELNRNMKHQVDSMLSKHLESVDLSQVTEEYTQRLSALEKKFQQAIREKDTLRKQLEQTRHEVATRMSKSELESVIGEKNEIIRELREEGEKLSKQQLHQSNIIKKLRLKEKENESTIKYLKETIEDLSSETERLKRSLTAKEEVERSQIEAVHQLTSKNRKLENEVLKLQSQYDDLSQSHSTMKNSFEAAKKELIDKNKASSELLARGQMLESLENEKKMVESQSAAVISQLDDLRGKLKQSDYDYAKKEQALRKENSQLLRRLEAAEERNEELSQTVVDVTKPLMRQLESLQVTHSMKISNFEESERELSRKISELQNRLHAAVSAEKNMREECSAFRSKVADLEADLSSAKHLNEMIKVQLEQLRTEKKIVEQDWKREVNELNDKVKEEKDKLKETKRNIAALQEQLAVEKSASDTERKRQNEEQRYSPQNDDLPNERKKSVAESVGSSIWEEQLEMSHAPRYTSMVEMQLLQTNLKQRDGELQQLQWELNRREQERTLLNMEMSTLLNKVEELEGKVTTNADLKAQFDELQQQYDTLCQLFGEKVEENEELKLDLQDVKEMYKNQLDELLKQQKLNT